MIRLPSLFCHSDLLPPIKGNGFNFSAKRQFLNYLTTCKLSKCEANALAFFRKQQRLPNGILKYFSSFFISVAVFDLLFISARQ